MTFVVYFTSKFLDLMEKQSFKVLTWNRKKFSEKIYGFLGRPGSF